MASSSDASSVTFVDAAQAGSIEFFVLKISVGQTIDDVDESGRSALHWAVEFGRTSLLSFLLMSQKINVNARDRSGCTALHVAIRQQMWECFDYLLDCPETNFCIPGIDGTTPLALLQSVNCERHAIVLARASPSQLQPPAQLPPLPCPPRIHEGFVEDLATSPPKESLSPRKSPRRLAKSPSSKSHTRTKSQDPKEDSKTQARAKSPDTRGSKDDVSRSQSRAKSPEPKGAREEDPSGLVSPRTMMREHKKSSSFFSRSRKKDSRIEVSKDHDGVSPFPGIPLKTLVPAPESPIAATLAPHSPSQPHSPLQPHSPPQPQFSSDPRSLQASDPLPIHALGSNPIGSSSSQPSVSSSTSFSSPASPANSPPLRISSPERAESIGALSSLTPRSPSGSVGVSVALIIDLAKLHILLKSISSIDESSISGAVVNMGGEIRRLLSSGSLPAGSLEDLKLGFYALVNQLKEKNLDGFVASVQLFTDTLGRVFIEHESNLAMEGEQVNRSLGQCTRTLTAAQHPIVQSSALAIASSIAGLLRFLLSRSLLLLPDPSLGGPLATSLSRFDAFFSSVRHMLSAGASVEAKSQVARDLKEFAISLPNPHAQSVASSPVQLQLPASKPPHSELLPSFDALWTLASTEDFTDHKTFIEMASLLCSLEREASQRAASSTDLLVSEVLSEARAISSSLQSQFYLLVFCSAHPLSTSLRVYIRHLRVFTLQLSSLFLLTVKHGTSQHY
ncbi:MAG: ankyrin repeat domain-containing protein [archaeon]|nr:ankyrin repeat domain-containing protein [archaeon]